MIEILHYLKDPRLRMGSYGRFLIMGNAVFISPIVCLAAEIHLFIVICWAAGWPRIS